MDSNNSNDHKENQGNSSTTSNRDRVNMGRDGDTYYRGLVTRNDNGRVTGRTVHNPKPLGQSGLSNSKWC